MMQEDGRETLYQDYVASMLKMLVTSYLQAHGVTPDIPSFIEMIHPAEKEPTAEQVKAHILKRLTEG